MCHSWLRQRPLRLCQIRCTSVHGRLLGTWVITKIIFIYTPFGNSTTGQTRRRIFTNNGSSEFSAIYNHCAVMTAWIRKTLIFSEKFLRCIFWKNNRLRQNFLNSVPKVFITILIDVLCSNFVKFGIRKIGEIVRYLPDKKKQNFAWLFSCCYCADRVQNLPGPATDNALRVLQISSKSVSFRQNYSRTREHRQNAQQSESNIRLKPSFELNNKCCNKINEVYIYFIAAFILFYFRCADGSSEFPAIYNHCAVMTAWR